MNEETLIIQINQLFEEMVRIQHSAIGDETKVFNDLQRLLNELATRGGNDIQEFIKELSAKPQHNLDFQIFCNNLLKKLSPSAKNASELISALRAEKWDKAKELIQSGIDVNYVDQLGLFPLLIASVRGNKECVETLLSHGAKVDTKNGEALFKAIEEGHLDIVEILLAAGVDVNIQWGGDTPLYMAVKKGHKDIVLLLLSKGANLNIRNGSWNMPLHIATSGGNVEIVRILLSNGADMNIFDGGGYTPLHKAIMGRKLEIFRILLEAGADPNAKAEQREYSRLQTVTPLRLLEDLLEEGELKETMRSMLRNHGAKQ
jgi:ankyrin repeat protein